MTNWRIRDFHPTDLGVVQQRFDEEIHAARKRDDGVEFAQCLRVHVLAEVLAQEPRKVVDAAQRLAQIVRRDVRE